ncbi:hypothetical protein H5410_010155, partial [Solanum commersonii]
DDNKIFLLHFRPVPSWNNIKQTTHRQNHSNNPETDLKQLSNTTLSTPKSSAPLTDQTNNTIRRESRLRWSFGGSFGGVSPENGENEWGLSELDLGF